MATDAALVRPRRIQHNCTAPLYRVVICSTLVGVHVAASDSASEAAIGTVPPPPPLAPMLESTCLCQNVCSACQTAQHPVLVTSVGTAVSAARHRHRSFCTLQQVISSSVLGDDTLSDAYSDALHVRRCTRSTPTSRCYFWWWIASRSTTDTQARAWPCHSALLTATADSGATLSTNWLQDAVGLTP